MQGTKHTPAVGTEITRTYGKITLAIQATVDGGFTVSATSGPARHDELTQQFTDLDAARDYWRTVKDHALAGLTAEQITEKVTADQPTEPVACRPTLAQLAPARRRRFKRPTMAGAHLKDLSAPQLREIAAHRSGVVGLRPGCDRRMLASIERKGYGTLNFETGRADRRQVIESLTLNARGLREAGTASTAA